MTFGFNVQAVCRHIGWCEIRLNYALARGERWTLLLLTIIFKDSLVHTHNNNYYDIVIYCHNYYNIIPYSALISQNLNFADSCLQSFRWINFEVPFALPEVLSKLPHLQYISWYMHAAGPVWEHARGHWKFPLNNFRGSRCIHENNKNLSPTKFKCYHTYKIIVVCPSVRYGKSAEKIWPRDTRCSIYIWLPTGRGQN